MHLINDIPALICVIIVFAGILLSIRNHVSLGTSFLIGAILLCLFFGLPPLLIVKSIIATILYPKTLSLAIIVSLILILSNCMEQSGQMQRMLNRFKGLLSSPRLNLIVFPALIGLLPMPGGAVFSAPMVKSLSRKYTLSGGRLSFINYWFRHIWEYWWPLYPSVLLITVMADINLATFILYMFPLTLIGILAGYLQLTFWKIGADTEVPKIKGNFSPFLKELIPILIVIFPGLGMGIIFSKWIPWLTTGKEIGLIIALIASIIWVWRKNSMTANQIKNIIANRQLHKMVYMIFTIFIFKGILEDCHAVDAITRELLILNIPLFLITALLPFLVGMITGIAVAFVGSTFPMIIPLITSFGQGHLMLPYMMLAMTCGFVGVLISPLHLCLILSNEYFDTDMKNVYRHLWLPCCGIICMCLIYFKILTYFVR